MNKCNRIQYSSLFSFFCLSSLSSSPILPLPSQFPAISLCSHSMNYQREAELISSITPTLTTTTRSLSSNGSTVTALRPIHRKRQQQSPVHRRIQLIRRRWRHLLNRSTEEVLATNASSMNCLAIKKNVRGWRRLDISRINTKTTIQLGRIRKF